jgi:hypothetical protein
MEDACRALILGCGRHSQFVLKDVNWGGVTTTVYFFFLVMADATQPVNSQPQVCVTIIEKHPIAYTSKWFPASQGIIPMQVGNDRNARNCPIGPDGKRDWSYGLLDCSDRSGLCT